MSDFETEALELLKAFVHVDAQGWPAWLDGEYSTCAYCGREFTARSAFVGASRRSEDYHTQVTGDHAPDCPVARALALLKREGLL